MMCNRIYTRTFVLYNNTAWSPELSHPFLPGLISMLIIVFCFLINLLNPYNLYFTFPVSHYSIVKFFNFLEYFNFPNCK